MKYNVSEMQAPNSTNVQHWNLKKIIFYISYIIIVKHLPDGYGMLGQCFIKLRRFICRPLLKEAKGIFGIAQGSDFGNGSCLVMKEHANTGKYFSLTGRGTLTIGRHVLMGQRCMVITQNHKYLDTGYDGFEVQDVYIGDYTWVGHNVIILPGVRIGKHVIIGAGSVVTKDVPDYAIVAGNPARVIKFRNSNK